MGQPLSWHIPSPHQLPSHSAKLRRGTLETHLGLVAKWVLTNRVKRLPRWTPTFRHTPGHPSCQPAHLAPFPPGGPHSSSLGAAGALQAEAQPRASQHLQTSEAGRRSPRLRRGQRTIKRSLLPAFCNVIANLKWLALKTQVINLKTQASTPAHQGNTYSTTALRKIQNCV